MEYANFKRKDTKRLSHAQNSVAIHLNPTKLNNVNTTTINLVSPTPRLHS